MHLLATTCVTLDEVEDALDLRQTPAQCVVLSFSDTDLSALQQAWTKSDADLPTLRLASLKKLRHPMSVDVYIESVIEKAKVVVVRCLGGLDYWRYGLEQISACARANKTLFVALSGDDAHDPRLAELSTASTDVQNRIDEYFRAGGPQNLKNALLVLATEARLSSPSQKPCDAPTHLPPISSWPPHASERKLSHENAATNATNATDKRPTALILFYRANVLAADTAPVHALIKALEREGFSPEALAITSLKDPAIEQELAEVITAKKPQIILNTTAFSALRDDATTVLDKADVPVLQVVLSSASQKAWDKSDRGLGPTDLAMNVILPELDGRILSRAISFKAEREHNPRVEHASVHNQPQTDRVAFVARLAKSWASLKATAPKDRSIVLALSDYPSRAGRRGYAVGLDTPKSVAQILKLLKSAGYETGDNTGEWDGIIARLCRGQTNETISVPLEAYGNWFNELPDALRAEMLEAWGSPADDPAAKNGAFEFPLVTAGNILVLVQPDRGSTVDKKQSYHDTTLPPRHAYLALYKWLVNKHKIDAYVHVGTHGTLEWLPGKALALSSACFPEAVLGPVPVIYPFIVNNPGEAIQAKRRLGAVTIGHLTPPLREAGLAGALGDLEGLVDEYAQADGVDARRMKLLEQEILDDAWRSGLASDCGIKTSDAPREAIAKLDAQLCDIKELAIRDGLHVFGQAPAGEHALELCTAITEAVSGEKPDAAGINDLLRESAGNEGRSLLAALDGRYVKAGPAGAPTRGRLDVLPTGRNLTSIDPRAIPTRTAAKIGARAADEVVRRHLQDIGEYPRSLVLNLWASASLRTGGDDLAQAFAYLGVKPVWDFGSNRVTGIEVIPSAKLKRPRIDVTLRVSGLFRDIFESQITLFKTAVQSVATLDEDADQNPLADAARSGLSTNRVFSSAPGTFGAGATDVALDGNWTHADDIGNAYLESSTHVVDRSQSSPVTQSEFHQRVSTADALVHPQDDRERDILDGDGVADYAGGFAAAAKMLGNDPALYHLDTSRPEAPKARTVSEEVTRVVRARLTNPQWITAMLAHQHRGVAEIAQGVDALYAFKATTHTVPSHLFDAVHDALIGNIQVLEEMTRHNPDATTAIAERLNDAVSRGMWTPRRNAVAVELQNVLRTPTQVSSSRRQPVTASGGQK